MLKLGFLKVLSVLALSLCLGVGAFAQSVTAGDIDGTLTDSTGAIIPNGKITATNPATGATETVESNSTAHMSLSPAPRHIHRDGQRPRLLNDQHDHHGRRRSVTTENLS